MNLSLDIYSIFKFISLKSGSLAMMDISTANTVLKDTQLRVNVICC